MFVLVFLFQTKVAFHSCSFQTESGLFCAAIKAPWVRNKIMEFRWVSFTHTHFVPHFVSSLSLRSHMFLFSIILSQAVSGYHHTPSICRLPPVPHYVLCPPSFILHITTGQRVDLRHPHNTWILTGSSLFTIWNMFERALAEQNSILLNLVFILNI